MNFSWAMDLDPKGANNQIKGVIDRKYAKEEEEEVAVESGDDSSRNIHVNLEAMDAEDEPIVGGF